MPTHPHVLRITILFPPLTKFPDNTLLSEISTSEISTPITNAESLTLPYLQAVIFEGLRFYPPFTGWPFKVVPPEGDSIDGKFIPGGTRLSPNFPALMRLKHIFGEDVEVFRPERWLDGDKDKVAEMRRVTEMVFGYGRWGCAGRHLAFLELGKVFVEVSTVKKKGRRGDYG